MAALADGAVTLVLPIKSALRESVSALKGGQQAHAFRRRSSLWVAGLAGVEEGGHGVDDVAGLMSDAAGRLDLSGEMSDERG